MGLFDTVHCEYPLPNPRHQRLEFQTRSLQSTLDDYTITRDGRLRRRVRSGGHGPGRGVEWPMHGDITIYAHEDSDDRAWVEYRVRFTHGRVEWIRSIDETPGAGDTDWIDASAMVEPARDRTPAGGDTAEGALLANLRRDRRELENLLGRCSDHWGYEDPVYRFYHQSFKVYALQHQTQAIVDRLQALAPDRPLNPWFLELVRSGTGRRFRPDDNARWTQATRPILEAFFHARYFLEMAVRYADLDTPRSLPSGYAALLYLFGLR